VTILTVAVANLEFGGLDRRTGDDSRLHRTLDVLREWHPHVILAQELMGRQPYELQRHARLIAGMLGMSDVIIGGPTPQSASGNRTAVFIRSGLEIIDSGPPDALPGLPWCEALLTVPGWPAPLLVASVHMPPRSGTLQLVHSETIGSYVTNKRLQDGTEAIIGGDWNCYPPDPSITSDQLLRVPVHLRGSRVLPGPGGTAVVNTAVYDQMTWYGFTEIAGALPPGSREPGDLAPTGSTGVGREMHGWVTPGLVPALAGYVQADGGGSDHVLLLFRFRVPDHD
jgi:hypothetical protein